MNTRSQRLIYEEVASLCDVLNQQGIEPTQQKLMALLQRGSASTYTSFLQKWREEQSSKLVRIDNSLFRQIAALIEAEVIRYGQIADAEAIATLNELEKSSIVVEGLQEKLKKEQILHKEQMNESEKRIKDLSNSLQALIKDSDTLRRQFNHCETERNRQETKHAVMTEKIEGIESLLNEKNKVYDNLKNDNERLKDELSFSVKKMNELNVNYQLLLQTLEHQKNISESIDKERSNLQDKVEKFETKLSTLTADAAELSSTVKVSQAKLQSYELENARLQDENKKLSERALS